MMSADGRCWSEFTDLEIDAIGSRNGCKQEKQLSASQRRYYSLCRRKSFAAFVASKRDSPLQEGSSSWCCCGSTFSEHSAVHKHVARVHSDEVQQMAQAAYQGLSHQQRAEPDPQQADEVEASAWIPDISHVSEQQLLSGAGKVLLFYRYCAVRDPQAVCAWQKTLCETLRLTGKVRLATEGINGTVGGAQVATDLYIEAMRRHPLFRMCKDDFKSSDGGAQCFTELKVGVFKEIVPMGVDPGVVSYQNAGVHLEPEEFHKEVEALVENGELSSDTVLLDCRNFYESKIGQFSHCLAPDIRKFSYFPDYVDQNLELFRDKKVLMYCTGGIRCERGSAYLRSKDVCREVYQLRGGIHKYLERFPEGFYRGKLFVFDKRFSISSNDDVIAECRYCGSAWDGYELCATQWCCQLVLSCPACRRQGLTACCPTCQSKGPPAGEVTPRHREECECTDRRPRIPRDVEQLPSQGE